MVKQACSMDTCCQHNNQENFNIDNQEKFNTDNQEKFNTDMYGNCKPEMTDSWMIGYSPCLLKYDNGLLNQVYPSNISRPIPNNNYYTYYNDGIVSSDANDPKIKTITDTELDRLKIQEPDYIRDDILDQKYMYQDSHMLNDQMYGPKLNIHIKEKLTPDLIGTLKNQSKPIDMCDLKVDDQDFLKNYPNWHKWNLIPSNMCKKTTEPKKIDFNFTKHFPEVYPNNTNDSAYYNTHTLAPDHKSNYKYGFSYNEFVK